MGDAGVVVSGVGVLKCTQGCPIPQVVGLHGGTEAGWGVEYPTGSGAGKMEPPEEEPTVFCTVLLIPRNILE